MKLFLFFFFLYRINCVAVCDLATLKMELIQDINDNGMLDCQRSVSPARNNNEPEEQKNKRLAAQWDSSCSFEATQDWQNQLKRYYGIDKLIDAVGDPYEFNSEEQVDMCEIVRTMIHKNNPGINMYKLTPKDIEGIDCVGFDYGSGNKGEDDKTKICAATSGSFFDARGWSIFLKPSVITIGKNKGDSSVYPNFILNEGKKVDLNKNNLKNKQRQNPLIPDKQKSINIFE